MGNNTVGKR